MLATAVVIGTELCSGPTDELHAEGSHGRRAQRGAYKPNTSSRHEWSDPMDRLEVEPCELSYNTVIMPMFDQGTRC